MTIFVDARACECTRNAGEHGYPCNTYAPIRPARFADALELRALNRGLSSRGSTTARRAFRGATARTGFDVPCTKGRRAPVGVDASSSSDAIERRGPPYRNDDGAPATASVETTSNQSLVKTLQAATRTFDNASLRVAFGLPLQPQPSTPGPSRILFSTSS